MDARRQHITLTPFTDGRLTASFSAPPAPVEIRDASGTVIEASDDPLAEVPPCTDAVKWGRRRRLAVTFPAELPSHNASQVAPDHHPHHRGRGLPARRVRA